MAHFEISEFEFPNFEFPKFQNHELSVGHFMQ
jgi:hypothetical protein